MYIRAMFFVTCLDPRDSNWVVGVAHEMCAQGSKLQMML
uniref:Uncharacterized protein n=1 Tax=Arundo donax TaxID=35708 RepID=A0A0A8YUU9_ARUDO